MQSCQAATDLEPLSAEKPNKTKMEHHRYLSDGAHSEFAYYLPAAIRSRIITTLNKNGVRYEWHLLKLFRVSKFFHLFPG
jgi:hypothetical protein